MEEGKGNQSTESERKGCAFLDIDVSMCDIIHAYTVSAPKYHDIWDHIMCLNGYIIEPHLGGCIGGWGILGQVGVK